MSILADISTREAQALLRHRVRGRLAAFRGQDIWSTSFFIERIDLASEAYRFQSARGPDGGVVLISDLIGIVRDEFADFVLLEDQIHEVAIEEATMKLICELCSTLYQFDGQEECPKCHHPAIFQWAEHELVLLESDLNLEQVTGDPIRRRAFLATKQRRVESAYKRTVSVFEKLHRGLNELASRQLGGNLPRRRPNLFQNIADTQDWFGQIYNFDPYAPLTKEEIRLLNIIANKRHVLDHNGGLVDQSYIDKTGDRTAKLSKPVQLLQSEPERAIEVIRRIIHAERTHFLASPSFNNPE